MSRAHFFYWALLPYLLISFATLHYINEDAYIYFRVAENIANGHGYVFNIGGEHIETGSSLPWQLIYALLSFTGIHLLIWAKLLGLLLGCINLCLVWRLSEYFIQEKIWRYLSVIATGTSMPFYMWMQLGLDAPLNTFVLLSLAFCLIDNRAQRFWPLLAIAVFVTRPEGFFYLLAVVPWLFLQSRQSVFPFRQVFIVVFACSLFVVFRLFYFHDLVPHAFYHKISLSSAAGLFALWRYVLYSGSLLLLVLLASSFLLRDDEPRLTEEKNLVLVSFLLVTLLWSLFGHDWNSYSRHVGTALPFFYLFCFSCISAVAQQLFKKIACALSVIFVIASLLFSHSVEPGNNKMINRFLPSVINTVIAPEIRWAQFASVFLNPDFEEGKFQGGSDGIALHFMANLGRFLQANYPQDSVVVWDQLGRTPWFAGSDFVFIDNTGLCTRDIGFYDYHQRLQENPSLIHSVYATIVNGVSASLWPEEKRVKSREEILQGIKDQNPSIIIARKSYLEKRPDSLLQALIQQSDNFEKSWIVHNQYIIYENRDILPKAQAIVPRQTIVVSAEQATSP